MNAYNRALRLLWHAAYKYIGATFGASPSQLGSITLTRALVQALTSPIGGLLGDRMDRTYLVAFGCILWGAMDRRDWVIANSDSGEASALPPDVCKDSWECLSMQELGYGSKIMLLVM